MISALAALEETNPDAVRLARFASLAARIEPELLRALRVELCEGADASAEADLWWSDIVELRSSSSIRLSPVVLRELRKAVAPSARDAYRVLQRLHAAEPQLAQLEEQLTFLALTEAPGKLEQPLLQVLGTLLERGDRSSEVASWAIQALPRLPDAARGVPALWSVLWAADAAGRGSARMDSTPAPEVLQGAVALVSDLSTGWVEVETELSGDQLRLKRGRLVAEPSADLLLVPLLEPLLLEVESGAGRGVVALPHDWSKPITVSGASVVVRTLGREHVLKVFEIREQERRLPVLPVLVEGVHRANAYAVGVDCVATAADVGKAAEGTVELVLEDGTKVPAEVLVTGQACLLRPTYLKGDARLFDPAQLRSVEHPLQGLAERKRPPAGAVVELGLPKGTVRGVISTDAASQQIRLEEGADALPGTPILFEERVRYQLGETPAKAGYAVLIEGSAIQQAIDGAQLWLELLRQAARLEDLLEEGTLEDIEALRAEIFQSQLVELPSPPKIDRLWASNRDGRRWLALACIGRQKLPGYEGVVREALREPRSRWEHQEALVAAEALGLEVDRDQTAAAATPPDANRPAAPWLGKLGPFPWRLWPNASVLGVRFLGGSKNLQERVLSIAQEWTEHASLRFERRTRGAVPIRIAFQESGSWSYHGTDCLSVAVSDATVNLQVNERTPEDELRHVVLHEFGHVLGLVNETQNPAARIVWNSDAVYQELKRQKLSREEVDQNVLGTYLAPTEFQYREFDAESVMLNPIPEHWLGRGAPDLNRSAPHISRSDAEVCRRFYPRPSVLPVEKPAVGGGWRAQESLPPRAAHVLRGYSDSTTTYDLNLVSSGVAVLQLAGGRTLRTGEKATLEVNGDFEITVASEECFAQLAYSLTLTPAEPSAHPDPPKGLNMLRQRLRRAKLPKREDDQYLVGTWHLNEFGVRSRLPATFELIAEVMSRFDITIVTGVRSPSAASDLSAALGSSWRCIIPGTTRSSESFAMVVLDTQRVKAEGEAHSIETPLRGQQLGLFRLDAIVVQLVAVKPAQHTDELTLVKHLITTAKRIYRSGYRNDEADLTILTAFAGVRGPTSVELDQLSQQRVHLPPALTRQGDNPPFDQIFAYPHPPSPEQVAGLIDLYERSPKALFPDAGLSNQQAIDQLSVRSPAWILIQG